MAVSESFDREVRLHLAELLGKARSCLQLPDEWDAEPWTPAKGSAAAEALLLTGLPFSMTPILAGLDLALTCARGFLSEAADGLVVAGHIQTLPTRHRIAALGPVARTAAEKAAAVSWLFDAKTADRRLARAALLELDGIQWQMRYLHDSGHDQLGDHLRREYELLIDAVNRSFDKRAVRFGSGRQIRNVDNQRLPSKTELFQLVLSDEADGRSAYGELSAFSHPTGHLQALSSSTWSYQGTQLVYEPASTVHDEGRLLEPSLYAFASAGAAVGEYIGQDMRRHMASFLRDIAKAWRHWCTRNACAPVQLPEP